MFETTLWKFACWYMERERERIGGEGEGRLNSTRDSYQELYKNLKVKSFSLWLRYNYVTSTYSHMKPIK